MTPEHDPDFIRVRDWLVGLQDRICHAIESADGQARFVEDAWTRDPGHGAAALQGGGRTRILRDGAVFEQAGIGFSDVAGTALPPAATARAAGTGRRIVARGRRVAGVPPAQSLRADHARQRAPLRAPCARAGRWRGGSAAASTSRRSIRSTRTCGIGTRTARALCEPFGGQARYAAHKRWCDDYFFLKHRDETRGVGGLFFDDLHGRLRSATSPTSAPSATASSMPTCRSSRARRDAPYGEREREFQLYRRGRYVEFNLVLGPRHAVRPAVRRAHRDRS